jgi:hypothetical protein
MQHATFSSSGDDENSQGAVDRAGCTQRADSMVGGPHGPDPRSSAMLWKCSGPDVKRASSKRPRRRYVSDAGVVQPTISPDRLPPRRRLATRRHSPARSTTATPSTNWIDERPLASRAREPEPDVGVISRCFPPDHGANGERLGANCSVAAIEGVGRRRKDDRAGGKPTRWGADRLLRRSWSEQVGADRWVRPRRSPRSTSPLALTPPSAGREGDSVCGPRAHRMHP